MNKKIDLIEALSNLNGAPGFEDDVTAYITNEYGEVFDIKEDTLRNLYINYRDKEKKDAPVLMLDAHSDEVGFIVQAVKENGLIKFLTMGGWIPYNATAQKVKIRNRDGKYISGVVSSKPPHFMSEEEKKKPVSIEQLFIDIGASSRAEVMEEFGIEIGAPIVPDVTFEYISTNDTMIGKAFDNRLGCGLVLETMKELMDSDLNINVVGAIASQEEVGLRGASVSARTVKPDVAIVFEGTPADDGFKPKDEAQSVLKKGPQVRHRDRSMITHPRFLRFARETAKENSIEFQDAVRVGGGTNGAKIHLSNAGVPTIVIGVPVRYIHTHYGIAAVCDYESAIKWAVSIAKGLNQDIIGGF